MAAMMSFHAENCCHLVSELRLDCLVPMWQHTPVPDIYICFKLSLLWCSIACWSYSRNQYANTI